MRRSMLACGLAGASLFGAGSAQAGAGIYEPGPDTCTTLNCNAAAMYGTYIFDTTLNNSQPFVQEIFTNGNECVRIDVTQQGTDLAANLICPGGASWRNDDRTASNVRPLIVALTPVRGWCTLILSHFAGAGTSADFTLRYGRYTSSNSPNCSTPTPQFSERQADFAKPAVGVDRVLGGPTSQ